MPEATRNKTTPHQNAPNRYSNPRGSLLGARDGGRAGKKRKAPFCSSNEHNARSSLRKKYSCSIGAPFLLGFVAKQGEKSYAKSEKRKTSGFPLVAETRRLLAVWLSDPTRIYPGVAMWKEKA